jgi:hypothetical protein
MRKINVSVYGEIYSHEITPIVFKGGEYPGSYQVSLDGELDGFVLPSGKRTESGFSLGNCEWEACQETVAHLETLSAYLREDFAANEIRMLA